MRNNKYKSIVNGLFMGLALTALVGCNDYLDIEPQSEISPEKYLYTADQLQAYVNKYYADYKENWENNSVDKGGMIPSFWGGGGIASSTYSFDDATDNQQGTNERYLKDTWTVEQSGGKWNFYNINALNYYLQTVVPRLENKELIGAEADLKQYVGEGYFLRALEYFYRLRRLGDFPIIKTTLTDNQAVLTEASKRQPRNEVARLYLVTSTKLFV